ncbi:fatty acyl-AMP ligase [Mastigocoleus testarum]|uniref:AMP-dependent synthetase n=1 Tax=Mastigocoleus testarum BC008 TaxID=371196 RepID=A0A0V7ZDC8_9CYAN|nr:fatty acyl-AMP ligase [Mastigocoleus testarum]KST62477.1 AMP-dependent synthetase [Mastigocoleus testarum BC008]
MNNDLSYSSEIYCSNSTLVDLLHVRAQNQPNRIAYTFLDYGELEPNKHFTYHQLEVHARAIAVCLQSLVESGERALLLYPPGLEFIAAFFGCLYGGVVATPAYPPRRNQKMSRLESIVASSQAKVALTTTSELGKIKERLSENSQLSKLHWIATDSIDNEFAQKWQRPQVNSDTLAFLQYTSGSTGIPKGVMVSHGNLLHNSNIIHQSFGHKPTSQGVIWLPMYHDMGLIGGVLQPLYGGFPVALMSPVDFLQKPMRWLEAISCHKATTSGGPNFAYDLCVRKFKPEQFSNLDLSSWEVAFTGAEPVRAQTLENFAATFAPYGFREEAFFPCYGMAETTLMVSGGLKSDPPTTLEVEATALEQNRVVVANDKSENVRTLVSCGGSWSDQKIAIVDPESLTECKTGQIGEIWVCGSSVAGGYWDLSEQTEETFHAYLRHVKNEDTKNEEQESQVTLGPFLRTGDLGFLHGDELFVTGRLKDMIIIRGQNYYPNDIELTVEKSHPALRPNCGAAFAVEMKGKEQLAIVQEVERSYLRKLDVNEVVTSIRRAVAAEYGLQIYAAVLVKTGSIPKTSSGKIQRYACRAGFLNGSLNVVKDWSENPQDKAEFRNLQAEVDNMLQELSSNRKI